MTATETLNQITVLYEDEKQKNHLVESFTSSSFTGTLKFTPYSSYPHDVSMSTHPPQHPQHPFSPTLYQKHLTTEKLGRICCYSQRVTSTQTILNEQLTHAPVGTVVIADHQVTGKGRGGNIWTSPAGCLMFSVKFQMYQAILLPFVQYLASLNMVRAINPYVDIRIKWPNDLYTPEGIKLGGMLCQSSYMDRVFDIVCGIGINVANDMPTTCLNTLYKKKHGEDVEIPFSRESILASFMNYFEKDLVIFEKHGFDPFRDDYIKYWLHTNQRVTLGGDKREVIITGIAPSGFLQACDVNDSTKQMELHPDGNSLDFLQGLLVQKEWKTEKPHECDNCK